MKERAHRLRKKRLINIGIRRDNYLENPACERAIGEETMMLMGGRIVRGSSFVTRNVWTWNIRRLDGWRFGKPCERTEADPSCEHYRCRTAAPTVTNLRTSPCGSHAFMFTHTRAPRERCPTTRVTVNVIGKSGFLYFFAPPPPPC